MGTMTSNLDHTATPSPLHLPRISIQFCTQCKWMLRAAYFAQELLSTFSTFLGEVALVPSTGGVFTVDITHTSVPQPGREGAASEEANEGVFTQTTRLWDRKTEGGFPETKTLKKLVRDIIDPSRDLGHVDRHLAPKSTLVASTSSMSKEKPKAPHSSPQDEDAALNPGAARPRPLGTKGTEVEPESSCDECATATRSHVD